MSEESERAGLSLAEFPPVPAADWEAAIRKDLKGADYEKKLVWRTEEGIAVRPYYRREDLAAELPPPLRAKPGWDRVECAAFPAGAVRVDLLQESGANAVQELAFAVAQGVELLAAGVPPPVEFVFAAGTKYFVEIAKLRAMRLAWAQATAAFGIAGEEADPRIHVRTSRLNKSIYDPYANLLRVTTEAMSAALGGCDTLAVEAFGFSPHLAENVQRVLREESHLDAVADPAAGSYYVEALTDALAEAAWKLFQAVEAEGGYAKALASGFIESSLAESRAALRKAVALRRRTLVGVNNYPDVNEKEPAIAPPAYMRLAEPFEKIRRRTAAHAKRIGRYPKVLLVQRGDLKMRMARANFCLNFLACAGFDIAEASEYAASDADLIVLCSSDPEYPALAQEVCPAVQVPVLIAGNPKDQIDALKAAGVRGFIHLGSDAVETLAGLQDALGMEDCQ